MTSSLLKSVEKLEINFPLQLIMDKSAKGTLVLSLVIAILIRTEAKTGKNVFNVVDYGAVGDGNTNDTQAFERTWKCTCNAEGEKATMIIPYGNTFFVYPLTLAGPCNLNYINIVISGKIVAPKSPEEGWKGRKQRGRWLIIRDVKGLHISGSGLLDGRGYGWWDILCTTHPQLLGCVNLAPTVLSLVDCNEVYMGNLTFVNSPQTHILVMGCNHVNFTFLTIDCPGSTPNTDGIHLQNSHGVSIHSTNIGSGDDCISIGDHTSNIYIANVNCGPGHGVSIGSLGRSGNEVQVENITVDGVHFFNTTNGLRIKTWQKGTGHVRGVKYQNIHFTNVKNPIIIDQHYCDVRYGCKATGSGVHISEVRYARTLGTSLSDYAINLNCSEIVPCTNILLERIELESSTPGVQVNSSCNNAYGNAAGIVQPKSCLLQST